MSTVEPHTVDWTVERVEIEPLSDAGRESSVNAIATLINTWNESHRET